MAVEILTIQEFNFFLSPLGQIVVIADMRGGPKVMIITDDNLLYPVNIKIKKVFFSCLLIYLFGQHK